MKRKSTYLITILIYLAIYLFLFLLLGISALFIILPRLDDEAGEPTARPTYRLAALPNMGLVATPTSQLAGSGPESEAAVPAPVRASTAAIEAAAVTDRAIVPSAGSSDTASSPASPAPGSAFPSALASTPVAAVQHPAIRATTSVQTDVVANATQAAATPTQIRRSVPINASKAGSVATPRPTRPPRAAPTPTVTPVPDYDYMLAEFFNSPTSNFFLLIYVAVVDPREIPIGDMKVVGTRLDQNLTYESPLTRWHYEGYSAPGEVIKSGNTKFEPPRGMETTSWVLHLEDAHGNRQSADVPFDVDANDKQWYFIKFRRKY